MTDQKTAREAYEAFLKGDATLDEVSEAANRSIARYFEQSRLRPGALMAPRPRESQSRQ